MGHIRGSAVDVADSQALSAWPSEAGEDIRRSIDRGHLYLYYCSYRALHRWRRCLQHAEGWLRQIDGSLPPET
jgi:hypothetical protein